MPQDEYITDVLVNAHYLINMPIMKRHGVGVSLGFKNHFGTIDSPGELHTYIDPSGSNYRSDYSPLVDIYKSSHIRDKTILTVGDGLFAAKFYTYGPAAWTTFGNKLPNSLFFSTDPVAIDCVMHDFVAAEMTDLTPHANDYLRAAGAAGLGAFERGDPWGSGYQQIDCLKVSTPLRPTASVLSISSSDSDATLTWEHNRANTSYEVWRGADPYFTPRPGDSPIASGLPPSPNCTMAGDTITCTDRDVVGGASSYYYLVRALNMAGAFEDSNCVGVFSFAMWSNDLLSVPDGYQ